MENPAYEFFPGDLVVGILRAKMPCYGVHFHNTVEALITDRNRKKNRSPKSYICRVKILNRL